MMKRRIDVGWVAAGALLESVALMPPLQRGFLAIFLFSGCLCANEGEAFSGYYAYGFEESRFSLVGSKERWWLDKLPPCVEQTEKVGGGTPILFVEVVGKLSSVGKFGHLGKYPRELVVEQYLSCRKLSPGERSGLYD